MKNLLIITLTVFTFLSCKAQQPILALYSDEIQDTNNAYYKDLDGDLTKVVGVWQYTNGNEIFKLVLKKKELFFTDLTYRNLSYYEDVIYGEYKYVNSSGVEVINTLTNIDSYTDVSNNSIYGNYIKSCDTCATVGERVLDIGIEDPTRTYLFYNMEIQHFPVEPFSGDIEQIKIKISREDYLDIPEGQPDNDRIPLVELTLEKQ